MPALSRFQTVAFFALFWVPLAAFAASDPVLTGPRVISVGELPGRFPSQDSSAPLQIVVFADFQCGDCQALEAKLHDLSARRTDFSLSMRHFPLCADCNSAVATNIHPNACKAARAAEAAGIVGGSTGFARMHDWLFAVGGQFEDAALESQVATLGLDATAFTAAMNDGRALQNIKNDIQVALDLGLHTTPMLLVNGEEVKDWKTAAALDRALDAALAAKAGGKVAAVLTSVERWTKEWSQQTVAPAASENVNRWIGAGKDAATVEVVLFGDFQERGSAQADAWIRAIVKERSDTRYAFRQFPADPSCNSSVTKRMHPLACKFAMTAAAVALAGGEDAYWKTHDRIFLGLLNGKGQDFADANLREICDEFKLDFSQVNANRTSAALRELIQKDIDAATKAKISELPTVFVNNKRIVRFRGPGADDDATLRAIIELAAKR